MIGHSSRRAYKCAVTGELTLDDVRDGAPAVWAGPANPAVVMLYDSSGSDWLHGTNFNFQLFNNAAWKTGEQGGLDFPQTPFGDYAQCDGFDFIRIFPENTTCLVVLSNRGHSTRDRTCYTDYGNTWRDFSHGSTVSGDLAWRGQQSLVANGYRAPTDYSQVAACGRLDTSKTNAERGRVWVDGVLTPPSSNTYFPEALNIRYYGDSGFSTQQVGFNGTIHAVFRWDRALTDQECADISADPNSLFASP